MSDHEPDDLPPGGASLRGRPRSTVLLVAGGLALALAYGLRWLLCGTGADGGVSALPADVVLVTTMEPGYGLAGLLAGALAIGGTVLLLVGGVAKGVTLGVRETRGAGD